jgi:hypothetical protein
MLRNMKEHLTLAMVPATNVRDAVRLSPRNDSRMAELPEAMTLWAQLVGRRLLCISCPCCSNLNCCCVQWFADASPASPVGTRADVALP